jgi:hypothetical protein
MENVKFIGIKGLEHHRLGFLASTNDDSTKTKGKREATYIRSIKFEFSEPGKIIEIACKALSYHHPNLFNFDGNKRNKLRR